MARSNASSPSPLPPGRCRRRTKTYARKCERGCCAVATYFPLAFVYGLTTWAVWTEAGIGLKTPTEAHPPRWLTRPLSICGVVLYCLLNTCYTIAVITDPGSPITQSSPAHRGKYTSLPTTEPHSLAPDIQPITVSSTGGARYCKKCQTPKPDRTHHCSTCRRCVLKMDHHCPWLATCVGLYNYKAFVLFLIYTSVFCWICFFSSVRWVWSEVFEQNQYLEEFAPVNIIILAVISGIIGLVLSGFTGWHLYLCLRGQTTIECLEKTRYLSGVRKQVERQRQDQLHNYRRSEHHSVTETLQRAGEQILEFHANAVPGASRLEEGEEHTSPAPSLGHHSPDQNPETVNCRIQSPNLNTSPAQRALRRTYSMVEEQRERDRYQQYLNEKFSEKLPNAFDLGWRRNLVHLFGPSPWLWILPICNTTGDGWRWEVSTRWIEANETALAGRRMERNGSQHDHHTRPDSEGEHAHDMKPGNDLGAGPGVSMRNLPKGGGGLFRIQPPAELEHASDGEEDQHEVSSDTDADTEAAWDDRSRTDRDQTWNRQS